MTFYFRQIFVYGNFFLPRHEEHLIAFFFIVTIIMSAFLAVVLLSFSKDESNKKIGFVSGLNALMGILTIFWMIA